jgi:hypothetical protein
MVVAKQPTITANAMPAGAVSLLPNRRQARWPAAMMTNAERSEKPSASIAHA